MTLKGTQLEAALVSMAGTAIYAHEMTATLEGKPMVPKSVEHLMSATQAELDVLGVQLKAVRLAAARDAEPLVTAWLAQLDMRVGGMFYGRTQAPHGCGLTVTGGIVSARLHHYALDGVRVVDIELAAPEIRLPDLRVVGLVEGIPVREHSNYHLYALRDCTHTDLNTKSTTKVLHVRVPIQKAQRSRWERSGKLTLR